MKDPGRVGRRGSSSLTAVVIILFIVFSPSPAQEGWRDRLMQPERTMDAIGVRPGMVIGEAGAGEGYFTFHLSRRVGSGGMVYANDIDRKALDAIDSRCRKDGVLNIQTVVGEVVDPLFPVKDLDMIILVYAFHDFARQEEWLQNAKRYLNSGATLVIIDRDPDKYGGEYSHFLTRPKLLEIVRRAGYEPLRVETFLERENIYIFSRQRL